ncbi:hypothetical protein GCM10025868_05550 [Angustibacter aerolatus]|uniref:Uncharacterized protein n=1 Tax=Angustibacter aerolatus TaxID=1162965 RepID=A0ABQ6JAV6_9ACTN|nr:hypothetical protein GCM10025868_05550 [Angustibacter aerolatus]
MRLCTSRGRMPPSISICRLTQVRAVAAHGGAQRLVDGQQVPLAGGVLEHEVLAVVVHGDQSQVGHVAPLGPGAGWRPRSAGGSAGPSPTVPPAPLDPEQARPTLAG